MSPLDDLFIIIKALLLNYLRLVSDPVSAKQAWHRAALTNTENGAKSLFLLKLSDFSATLPIQFVNPNAPVD